MNNPEPPTDSEPPLQVLVTDDGQIAVIAETPHTAPNGDWYPIVDTPKPDDTATETFEYSLQVVDGQPTVVWVPRPLSELEVTERRRGANEADLRDLIRQAVAGNQAAIEAATSGQVAAFLNLPTDLAGATVGQAVTAIGQNRQAIGWLIGRTVAHERQLAALIRLVVAADLLDTKDGT